ncbi:DUF1642 domain-containing protein [Lactococcus sp. KTH0-1S]|uniref:DUF1642 domain-containing protein n=1 Tax=Lactococcus sp. KTH0-1S TaxID=3438232 RepID=UPI00403C01DF
MTKFEEKKKEAYEKASMKSYGNTAGSMQMRHLLNELENAGLLKEQQALPVVPECVDKWYKFHMNGTFSAVITAYAVDGADKAVIWLVQNGGMDLLCKMKLYGYTVEKPQLFYLCEKNTGYYLRKSGTDWYGITSHYSNDSDENYMNYKFTQKEIDKLDTGSYELVPVEDGE